MDVAQPGRDSLILEYSDTISSVFRFDESWDDVEMDEGVPTARYR